MLPYIANRVKSGMVFWWEYPFSFCYTVIEYLKNPKTYDTNSYI